MRCEAIDVVARPRTEDLICTDSRACPGGCYWVSRNPPVCSACAAAALEARLELTDEADDDGAENRSGLFGAQRCPASATPAPHAQLWLDATSGYCVRCGQGFVT